MTRVCLEASWFSFRPPDETHDYYFLMFIDESMENDVIIKIKDIEKLREEFKKC